MTTERLYYTDPYLRCFEAAVAEVADAGRRVYLDRTAFYPSSGGQPHDVGLLGGSAVVDVVDEGDRIAHVLADPFDLTGQVTGEIDWGRRYDHMQQHTGQHVLSAVFEDMFGWRTASFHLGSHVSTVELTTSDLSAAQSAEAERRANEIAAQALGVAVTFEDAEVAHGLRKASEREGTLRIVTIAGVDRNACGGTHVRSTAEIAPVLLRRTEKLRGNMRLEFLCGERARRAARADYDRVSELCRIVSTEPANLVEAVGGLRTRVAAAEKGREALAVQLAGIEGAESHRCTQPDMDGLRRMRLAVSAIDEAAQTRAKTFAQQGRAIALLIGPKGVLVACSVDCGKDAAAAIKATLAKGGGSATLAQGSFSDSRQIEALEAALGFLQS